MAMTWQPIETAPREVTRALIYWPAFSLNADLEQSEVVMHRPMTSMMPDAWDRVSNLSDVRALLYCYYSPERDPDDGWGRSMVRLLHLGLVASPTGPDGRYTVTERGRVYCEAIRAVPLPVQVWEMPQADPAVDPHV